MADPSDPDRIKRAWVHVSYEIEMYETLRNSSHLHRKPKDNIDRALYESLCVHMRNLIDFLLLPARLDDMVAVHFVSTWTATLAKGSLLDTVRNEVIPKQIAHLTYDRLDIPDTGHPWDWNATYAALDVHVNKFIDDARIAGFELSDRAKQARGIQTYANTCTSSSSDSAFAVWNVDTGKKT